MAEPRPDVSIVVVAFDMQRELPRTVASLSRRMQRGVDEIEYEVIVVDNGSSPPAGVATDTSLRLLRIDDASPSPAAAVNRGLAEARGELVGVCIDGARIVSPGLVQHAEMAARLHPRPIIATLGFHLGPGVQTDTIKSGYDQEREDRLLTDSRWEEDGYRLFAISTFAGSSADGWFLPIAESNALFMPRAMWTELDGYDESFQSPGGGLVNLDTFARACALPATQTIVLLGEGTFHQVHGGVATNARTSPWNAFHDEYVAVRGRSFEKPQIDPIYLGRLHPDTLASVRASADRAMAERHPGPG